MVIFGITKTKRRTTTDGHDGHDHHDTKKSYCATEFDTSEDKKKGLELSIKDPETAMEDDLGLDLEEMMDDVYALMDDVQVPQVPADDPPQKPREDSAVPKRIAKKLQHRLRMSPAKAKARPTKLTLKSRVRSRTPIARRPQIPLAAKSSSSASGYKGSKGKGGSKIHNDKGGSKIRNGKGGSKIRHWREYGPLNAVEYQYDR